MRLSSFLFFSFNNSRPLGLDSQKKKEKKEHACNKKELPKKKRKKKPNNIATPDRLPQNNSLDPDTSKSIRSKPINEDEKKNQNLKLHNIP